MAAVILRVGGGEVTMEGVNPSKVRVLDQLSQYSWIENKERTLTVRGGGSRTYALLPA